MSEASRGRATSPEINWRMNAALENVPHGEADLAEVTSLKGAVRARLGQDPTHRGDATLTPAHAVQIDGVSIAAFTGDGNAALTQRLPGANRMAPWYDAGEDHAG